MKHILSGYLNKEVEINYGGTSTIKGRLQDIMEDVLKLTDLEETVFYVPIGKIHVLWEVKESGKSMGFVGNSPAKNRQDLRK